MRRVLPLFVVSLFVLQIPLSALPVEASHARNSAPGTDSFDTVFDPIQNDAGCLAASPTEASCPVVLKVDNQNMFFKRRDGAPSQWDAIPGTEKLIRKDSQIRLLVAFNSDDQHDTAGSDGGACDDRLEAGGTRTGDAGETTVRRVRWSNALFTGEQVGTDGTPLVQVPSSTTTIPIVGGTQNEAAFNDGYETRSGVEVKAEVWCSAAGEEDKDVVWTFHLNGLHVDNTPPSVVPKIEPSDPAQPIARIGDPWSAEVKINDGDFQNHRAICDQYVLQLQALPRFSNQPENVLTPTNFHVGTTCAESASVSGTVSTPTSGASVSSTAYDYDNTAWSVNRVRMGEAGHGVCTGPRDETCSALPLVVSQQIWIPRVNVTDESGNLQTTRLDGVSVNPKIPRIDAVAPRAIPRGQVVVSPIPGAARITVNDTGLAYDAVGFDLQVKLKTDADADANWVTLTRASSLLTGPDNPGSLRRLTLRSTYSYDATPTLPGCATASGCSVHFRIRQVDDAGNVGPWQNLLALGGNPERAADITIAATLPTATLLTRPGGSTTVPQTPDGAPTPFHPFDTFGIRASDPDDGIPTAGTPVRVRMWKQTSPTTPPQYWNNQLATWGAEVLNSATRVSDTSVDGKSAPVEYRWDLNTCASQGTCIETGTYHLEVLATDNSGNTRTIGPFRLQRDLADPEFMTQTGQNVVVLPTGSTGNVQQGTFVPVNLKVRDLGSGFKYINFSFVPSSVTGARPDLAVTNVFGARAVACFLGVDASVDPGNPVAVARIPANGVCDPLRSDPRDPTTGVQGVLSPAPAANLLPNTYFLCTTVPTGGGGCTYYETGLRSFTRTDITTRSPSELDCPTGVTHTVCYPAATPAIHVSTDGVPFGTYKINVELVDWSGRSRSQTLTQTFTVVPRVVVPNEVVAPWGCDYGSLATTPLPHCLQPNKRYEDGKIDLTVYAAYTDDISAGNVPCPTETRTPNSVASRTGTCSPSSVVVDYLPANQPAAESNYRVLKSWNFPPPPVVAHPDPRFGDGNADEDGEEVDHFRSSPDFAPYWRIEDGVRFYAFELRNFTPPSSLPPLPTPAIVRVTVKGTMVVDGQTVEVTEVVRNIELSGRVVPSDLRPLKPFTAWAVEREPTYYEHQGTTRTSGTPADVWWQFAFEKPGLPPLSTAVYYRVYDRNLTYLKEQPATASGALSGAITASATTLTLTSASAATFPSQGGIVQIGTEKIRYAARSGNDLTGLTRGAESTTAASHAAGAAVTLLPLIVDDGTAPQSGVSGVLAGTYWYSVSAVHSKNGGGVAYEGPRSGPYRVVGGSRVDAPLASASPACAPGVTGTMTSGYQATLSFTAPAGAGCVPAGYAATPSAYRVYRAYRLDVTQAQLAQSTPTSFACNEAQPSDPTNPCRLVFWADGVSDNRGRGYNWSAFVNISSLAGIEAVQNPNDPDHPEAHPTHLAGTTSRHAHGVGMLTTKDHEFNLTRGRYLLEISAHPKPATPPTDPSAIRSLTELGYLVRPFQVETRRADISILPNAGDLFESASTSWTDRTMSLHVCLDARNFVRADRLNVSASIQLGSTGEIISGVSTTVRTLNAADEGCTAGERPQAYNVTLTIPPYSHGESFQVSVSLTPDVILVPGSLDAKATTAKIVALDDRGPALALRMDRVDPLGAATRENMFGGSARTTLASAVSATATTLPVASHTGLPPIGVVTVDGEAIYYSGKATVSGQAQLTGAVRGYGGTTAATHATNAVVKTTWLLVHGTADEDVGSGVKAVDVAFERVLDRRGNPMSRPEYYDATTNRYRTNAENLPIWMGAEHAGGVWTFANLQSGTVTPLLDPSVDNLTHYRIWVRARDNLGNVGGPTRASPVLDARPPEILAGKNGTAPVTGLESAARANDPRHFFAWVKDNDGTQTVTVQVHLVPPNGRLYVHNLSASTTGPCAAGAAAPLPGAPPAGDAATKCYAVQLGPHEDDEPLELDWAGEYRFYFVATDAAGNRWCSYGPCDGTVDPTEHPTFSLLDDGAPLVDDRGCAPRSPRRPCVAFTPPFGAAGGVVTANAYIQEASGMMEGYPRAVFYLRGNGTFTELGNGTMRNASEGSVDPAAGFGTWALSTFDAGIEDLYENQTICVVIHARDVHDNFASTGGATGDDLCPNSFTVLENAPPFVTLVSPAEGGWAAATPRIEWRVDDVNLNVGALVLTARSENGATLTDSTNLTREPIRVGTTTPRIIAWNVVYRGGNYTDGANVTFTLTARDNFTATNSSSVSVRIDARPPSVDATVLPVAPGAESRTYVGDGTRVRVAGADSAGGSGLARVEYRVNAGSWVQYTEPFAPTGGDTFRLEFAAVDVAGNRREGTPLTFWLDKEGPTVTIVRSGTNTTITAVDALTDVDAGNVTLYYKTSASAADFRTFPFDHVTGNTYTANVGALSGPFIYYVEAKDLVGNTGYARDGGQTCTAQAPCGLTNGTRAPPTVAIVAPAAGASLTGASEVRWTANAFPGSDPRVTIEVANADRRVLVADDVEELTGARTLDPARLNLTTGEWRVIVTVDDGVNAPVEASRTISILRERVLAPPRPPQAPIEAGQELRATISVTHPSKDPVEVIVSITRDGAFVRNDTYPVTNGQIAYSFKESEAGSYAVAFTVRYADGTSDAPISGGTYTVRSVAAGPGEAPGWPLPTVLVMGAIVVVLGAAGAFGRWRK